MNARFRKWFATLVLAVFLLPGMVAAQSTPPESDPSQDQARNAGLFSGVSQACWENGSCTLCDGMIVFINVANGILALLAIVAVIFFVYGAGHLALSSGNENYVYKGKEAIKASVIGTIIVLGAWQIMAIVVMVIANGSGELVNRPEDTRVNWVKNWYTVAESCRNK